ncbi:MAG: hypothetical protein JW384_02690 [Nitrosomonadaceae bacterium]|nr:hypothetical protein [Nitrosomonadaceae bacterium]
MRMCYGIFGVLIVGLAIGLLSDRPTIVDPRIKSDPRLHEVVARAIGESAWTESGCVCSAASLRRFVELSKIAPDSEFVSLSYRQRRWRAIVAPSATPSVVFEIIAVRRSSYEMINVHGQDISTESFLRFLVCEVDPKVQTENMLS